MKATGIVRRIDGLGRIVIPKEIRHTMEIHDDDPLEIFVGDGRIILQKYQPGKYTEDELREALALVCQETGKDPVTYLRKVKGESL